MKQEKEQNIRTSQQNKALHVYFTLLADELNSAGYDIRKTLKASVDIPWTAQTIKQLIWKPIMYAQLHKASTTQLTTAEIDKIFDTINRHIGEKFGIHIPFPSIEEIIFKETYAKKKTNKG